MTPITDTHKDTGTYVRRHTHAHVHTLVVLTQEQESFQGLLLFLWLNFPAYSMGTGSFVLQRFSTARI